MRYPAFFALPFVALPVFAAAPALAGSLKVLADTAVTASLVQQVTGDLAEIEILLDQSADPHDFQLRPSQVRALQDTDMLFWTGPELTPWLARAASQMATGRQQSLLHHPDTQPREYGDEAGHGHDHATGDGHEAGVHTLDPHAWLDPGNGAAWLGVIAAQLAQLDPDTAETYSANAASARAELARLDTRLKEMLEPVRDRPFVTFHDAYGYFTRHFGMPDSIAVSLGDASTPSAARIAEIRATIAESDARCAFPEAGQSPETIRAVIEGSSLTLGEALSPEGIGIEIGSKLYPKLLREIAQHISECQQAEG